jgi:HprK-related kinase A
VRVSSDSGVFAEQLQRVYRHFAFDADPGWSDIHAQLLRARGVRRWFWPQVLFRCDGLHPFEPFPSDSPTPLFEWGVNWLIGQRMNDLLLLHAGALERDGIALVLPATPGSGKSTLSAALSLRGWRLLSDEFGAYDPQAGCFRAILKPVALKNQSIDVIRGFEPSAPIGPAFPKTRKGTVAHLAASAATVAAVAEGARPGAIVLPRWSEGSPTRLERLSVDEIFPALAYNAFNYALLGDAGFDAALTLARNCQGWRLEYSSLHEAIAALDSVWPEVLQAGEPATRLSALVRR